MGVEPFDIYALAGFGSGTLGLCKQPDTAADFATIAAWQPSIAVTLTGKEEFPDAGVILPQQFQAAEYNWLHLPVTDFGVPLIKEQDIWQQALGRLLDALGAKGKVLIHCKGGNGRSGMLMLKLLTLQGEDGKAALERIRHIRPGAVETDAQLEWATSPL